MASSKRGPNLTNQDLVDSLDTELKRFSDDYFPLHASQLKAIKRCTTLVNEEEQQINNVPKRRSHTILKDLWTHLPEAFLLCSLAMPPSKLGTLKSIDYMASVLQWWDGSNVPGGLTQTLDRHSDMLPNVSRDELGVRLPVFLGELLEFLKQNLGQMPVDIVLPFTGNPSPFLRLAGYTKIELSSVLMNDFLQQR